MKILPRWVRVHHFSSGALLLLLGFFAPGIQTLAQSCAPTPVGMVAWWQAENSASDLIGSASGELIGSEAYAPGEVGSGFSGSGSGCGVLVTNTPELQLQTLTIEGWLKRARADSVSSGSGGSAGLAGFGLGGYFFWMSSSGNLEFNKMGDEANASSVAVQDVNFHHIAVTFGAGQLQFYLDGVNAGTTAYNPAFTFAGQFGIGCRPDNGDNCFNGVLDEISIYNRVLGADEIQSIFKAGRGGKCLQLAPFFAREPASQSQVAGGTVVFSATAGGRQLLSYLWTFNGTAIAGATNSTLNLWDVQTSQAGLYALTVSNAYGTATSTNAVLTIEAAPLCVVPPPGIVGWWRGETNTLDNIGIATGALVGNEAYTAGEVGSGFIGGGSGDGVLVTNTAALQLQTLTIEAWVKRGSTNAVSQGSGGNAIIAGFGNGGYSLYLNTPGVPIFATIGQAIDVAGTAEITDTNFHHLAACVGPSLLDLYLDGTNIAEVAFTPAFSFSSGFGIGFRPDNGDNSFQGVIDEVSIYNRALTSNEVHVIYAAGPGGKCFDFAPQISRPPGNQTVYTGMPATFSVSASGTPPLAYQWRFDGTNVPGANGPVFTLTGAQPSQAGIYSVIVSNEYGLAESTNAILTVNALPPCVTPPDGIVGWWRGDNNTFDYSNNGATGSLVGGEGYGAGEVGSGFSGDGSAQGVLVTNTAALQLQNLTIEAWIKRGDPGIVSHGSGGVGVIAGFGNGGYVLYLDSLGQPTFGLIGGNPVAIAAGTISDTNFHHLAVAAVSGGVNFYVDGVNVGAGAYSPGATFSTGFGIGYRPDNADNSFLGVIDDLAVYNRALTVGEIQGIYNATYGGKCYAATAPVFTQQPADQRGPAGGIVTLTAAALGALPLHYQWNFNGTILSNAIHSTLIITNLQASNAGIYSVSASNQLGVAVSTDATIRVDIVTIYANGAIQTNSPGLFSGVVTLELTNYYADGDIFYTLDGSTPSPLSPIYTGPITVTNSTVITTLAYTPDFRQSAYSDPFSILILPGYSLGASTPGGGMVTVNPLTNSYTSNTLVTLTATASNGWTFLQWSGDAFGSSPTNAVRLTRDKSVQAIFGTAVGNPTNSGGAVYFDPPGPVFPYGSVLTATAVPLSGNEFVLWGESASGRTNPLSFAVVAPSPSISALFVKAPTGQFTLTVLARGGGGVILSPQANGYTPGQSVTITAVPNPGASFLGWGGGATGNQNPLTLVMNQSYQVSARFSPGETLAISLYDNGSADAGIQLDILGQIGEHFRLDTSTNLNLWTPLLDATNFAGTLHYLDVGATNQPAKFYRAVILP